MSADLGAPGTRLRFQAGGTLGDGSFYLCRPADRALFDALRASRYCHILAPSQIGKSSLRRRTQMALAEHGLRCANLDLMRLGLQAPAEQWYFDVVDALAKSLGLSDPIDFWDQHSRSTPAMRFGAYLREQVLPVIHAQVVIFIDELDALRGSPLADDFLGTIRALYNERAENAAAKRLCFCLIGLAAPIDVIEDAARSPFNISHSIELDDFTEEQARGFLPGLVNLGDSAAQILAAVMAQTDGHPYMTQALCDALVRSGPSATPSIDRARWLADELFIRGARDANLLSAARRFDRPLADVSQAEKLSLYRRVALGERCPSQTGERAEQELRLAGMVKVRVDQQGPRLVVRNRIFAEVFDVEWIRKKGADRLLSEAVQNWLTAGRSPDYALRGQALQAGLAWLTEHRGTADEQEFVRECQRLESDKAMADAQRLRALERARILRLGLVIVSVLALSLLGASLWALRTSRLERQARRAEEQARKGAIQVAEQILYVADRELEPLAGTADVRGRLLRSSAELLGRLRPEERADADALRLKSVGHSQQADLELSHGNLQQARSHYEQALAIDRRLVAMYPKDVVYQMDLATSHGGLGDVALRQGRLGEAMGAFTQSLRIREALWQAAPMDTRHQRDLAVAHEHVADVALTLRRVKEADRHYAESLRMAKALADRLPASEDAARDLAVGYERKGDRLEDAGQLDGAHAAYVQALSIWEPLMRQHPDNTRYQRDVAGLLTRLGGVLRRLGRAEEAARRYARSQALLEALLKADENHLGYQADHALLLVQIGDMAKDAGRTREARGAYLKSIEIRKQLSQREPNTDEHRRELAVAYDSIGDIDKAEGHLAEAQKAYESGLRVAEELARREPSNPEHQRDLLLSYERTGDVALEMGQTQDAERAFSKGLVIAQALIAIDGQSPKYLGDVARMHDRLGEIALAEDRQQEAATHLRQNLALREQAAQGAPTNPDYQAELATALERLGDLALSDGKAQEADALYARSMQINQRLVGQSPGHVDYQHALLVSKGKLGDLSFAKGEFAKSHTAFQQSFTILQGLRGKRGIAEQARDEAVLHEKLANVAQAQHRWQAARQHLRQSLSLWREMVEKDPANLDRARGEATVRLRLADLDRGLGDRQSFGENLAKAEAILARFAATGNYAKDALIGQLEEYASRLRRAR